LEAKGGIQVSKGPIALTIGTLAILLIAAAGCGGGSDDSSTSANAISKAAFVKKGDAICQKGSERMARAFSGYLKKAKTAHPNKAVQEELVVKVLVPSVRREVKEFQALGAPGGDEDRVAEIVKALEEGVETAEGNPEAVTNSSDVVFGIASRLAGEYGLEVCGGR
jgi:ABC-type phosphate transport system substrate-binding protein